MAFNPYCIPFRAAIPTHKFDRVFCVKGKAPSIQIIGDTFTNVRITNGVDTQSIPYSINAESATGFNVFSLAEINYSNTVTGKKWLVATLDGVDVYSPFIKFCNQSALHKIEYYHQEPIVYLNGRYLSYANSFKQIMYIKKRFIRYSHSPSDTTEQKNGIDFDFHKILSRNYTMDYKGPSDLIHALSIVDNHSYIKLNDDPILNWEVGEVSVLDDDIEKTTITFKSELNVTSNIANAQTTTKWMDINPIQFLDYYNDYDETIPLVTDVAAKLFVSGPSVNLSLVGQDPTVLPVTTDSQNGLNTNVIVDLTPLLQGKTYYYQKGDKRTPCFRAPLPNERLLKVIVNHTDVLDNGGSPMFYNTLTNLTGFYPVQTRLLRKAVDSEDLEIERNAIEYKMYQSKKLTYSIEIKTHPTSLTFLHFADSNDNVTIELDGVTYNAWSLEVSEPKYLTDHLVNVTLTWFAGEILRSRNKAKALTIHADYDNADYDDSYFNY